MAEIIAWANGKGWTVKLTPDEADTVKSDIAMALSEGDTEIQIDIYRS